jgi:hypothetical protein
MRTAVFLVNTLRVVVISYGRFGTTYRSHLRSQDLVVISYRRFATTLESGPNMLSRNVGKKLLHHALQ